MAQPGMFKPPGDEGWVARRLQELEARVARNEAANIFGRTGIAPKNGGTDFDGYVNVNGPMSIMGALTLQPGSIENDALTSPLKTGSSGYTASNQSFTTAPTAYGTQQIPVPAGFTQAVVMNGVSAGGTNSTVDVDFIYVASSINGVAGGELPTRAAGGQYASASSFGIRTLTGLTAGSTISVSAQVRTNAATWTAASANIININAIAIFYR